MLAFFSSILSNKSIKPYLSILAFLHQECYKLSFSEGCYKNLEKLLKFEISERSVVGVRVGKSGPLERASLVTQSQGSLGFRVAERLQKKSQTIYEYMVFDI